MNQDQIDFERLVSTHAVRFVFAINEAAAKYPPEQRESFRNHMLNAVANKVNGIMNGSGQGMIIDGAHVRIVPEPEPAPETEINKAETTEKGDEAL